MQRGLDLVAVGVPKTIDNDVGDSEFKLIDHTPGYGSVAKYWMHMVQNANEENAGSCPADPVLVMQAMGRKIGFIPAAARLADPERQMPLLIYLAERPLLAGAIGRPGERSARASRGRCLVVVSEGFDVGELGEVKDSFGHTSFSSSQLTVAQTVVNYLNRSAWPPRDRPRGNVSGTDQRHSMAYASTVDLEEAYRGGQKAAELAAARRRAASWPPSSASRACSTRALRQGAAGRSRQQRADLPGRVDRARRLRRDRRFRPLCPAVGGRRHGQPADGRRPAAADPLPTAFMPSRSCRRTCRRPTEK